MSIIIPANSAVAGGYDVDNSVRFNNSEYLQRTNGTATDDKKYSLSFWVKRSKLGEDDRIFNNQYDGSNWGYLMFKSDNTIRIADRQAGTDRIDWITTQVFRDISAWYHFYLAIDTTQGTADNRVKFYVNGTQVTSFTKNVSPSLNNALGFQQATATNLARIATADGGGNLFSGYMSEIVFIDGTQNAVTDFGEFDEDSGIFKPIDVSGLTFGDNGYYLNFQDSAELGTDVSGESNTYTEVNLTAVDQSTDTCTNNFATLNILDTFYTSSTISDGNLTLVGGGTNANMNATIGLASGKWYWETKVSDWQGTNNSAIGISSESPTATNYEFYNKSGNNTGYGYYSNGSVYGNGGTPATGYGSAAGTHYISVALDLDNNKIAWGYDGTFQGSANPATGANMIAITAPSSLATGLYFPAFTNKSGTKTLNVNFGSPPYSESGGETDGNGYGNFAYAVPSGYFALNTKNLSEVLS